jgi:hypothetical protein
VPLRRRRRSAPSLGGGQPNWKAIGGAAGVILAALGVWWGVTRPPGGNGVEGPWDGPDSAPLAPLVSDAPPPGGASEDPVPPLDLPPLSASDIRVRAWVARLSAHPQLAAWLVTDRLIERFVLSVVEVAGGSNPSEHLPFLVPSTPFPVRSEGGRLFMADAGPRRHDLLANVVASLDTRGTLTLYRQLSPLLEESYRGLGLPGGSFDQTLRLALDQILSVGIPTETPALVPYEGVYIYQIPALEERRGAEKALLRMGPDNIRQVQAKLRELRAGLDASGSGGGF